MIKKSHIYSIMIACFGLIILAPMRANAMHIAEGYLPLKWCIFWGILTLPFFILGLLKIKKHIGENAENKMLIGVSGAFSFVLSAMKLPSFTGSTSHPTGIGLGAILFGPFIMTVVGTTVLLFQALFIAHGGLTTLGANAFSMAVIGSLTSYGIFNLCRQVKLSVSLSIFIGASLGNLATYMMTSFQLALAFPDPVSGLAGSLVKFMGIFAVTQIPLAISEGILTVLVMKAVLRDQPHYFDRSIFKQEVT